MGIKRISINDRKLKYLFHLISPKKKIQGTGKILHNNKAITASKENTPLMPHWTGLYQIFAKMRKS